MAGFRANRDLKVALRTFAILSSDGGFFSRTPGVVEGEGRTILKGLGKKLYHILLVFWPVLGDTTAGTYPDMRQRMCLDDEPKSFAILWNYFLPRPQREDPI
jgi:hypothetical protein